jgi:hypothetical protein
MLGHKATDRITGLKGVITAKAEFLHAPLRMELTPTKVIAGKPLDSVWLDEPRLEIGAVAVKVKAIPATIQLGDMVLDSITGFKGVATGRFTFLNGCLRIEVSPTMLKDGKPIEATSFDEQRLTSKSKVEKGGPFDSPPARSTPK